MTQPSAPSVPSDGPGVESIRQEPRRRYTRCSFCGKGQDQVRKLVAGPGVYICDQCIELVQVVLDEDAELSRKKPRKQRRLSAENRLRVQRTHGALNTLCALWTELREELGVEVDRP